MNARDKEELAYGRRWDKVAEHMGLSILGWSGNYHVTFWDQENLRSFISDVPLEYFELLIAAGLSQMKLADTYQIALKQIKENQGLVCENYELCDHVSCRSSHSAWIIAEAALSEEKT